MTAFICLSLLVFIAVTYGQKVKKNDCDHSFVKDMISAKQHCFGENLDILRDFLTSAILAQHTNVEGLESVRAKRDYAEIAVPLQWHNQVEQVEEIRELKPEKMEVVEEKFSCLEKALKHNEMYQKIQSTCSPPDVAVNKTLEDHGNIRMFCLMRESVKRCPKLVAVFLNIIQEDHPTK